MSMVPLQRPLDWVIRFLFQGSARVPVTPNAVALVMDITREWPLDFTGRALTWDDGTATYVTIAGEVTKALTVPADEHWRIAYWSMFGDATIPATDVIRVNLRRPAGSPSVTIFTYSGFAASTVNVVGGIRTGNVALQSLTDRYLPPGSVLDFSHTSVAGGVNVNHVLHRLVLQPFEPL